MLSSTRNSASRLIDSLEKKQKLNDIEQAKVNCLKISLQYLYDIDRDKNTVLDPIFDSTKYGSLLEKAENYIIQSRPDEGIPLIFQFLKTVDEKSDSAVYAKIYLAEAYREKQEYKKGIEIIYRILEHDNISLKNRAFAYNRIAALYDECGNLYKNRGDSVLKYSKLCIDISRENNLTKQLAASQNELAFIYRQREQYPLSIDYGLTAYDNFIKLKMYPQAMNTAINIAKTYIITGKLLKAKETTENALELGTINKNKNLYRRLYLLMATINYQMDNYQSAYDFLKIAFHLQSSFYRERINVQINEMSAKYETEIKEQRNKELKRNIEIEKQKSQYFLAWTIILIVMGAVSLMLFYFIRKNTLNKKKLAESESARLQEKVSHQKRELACDTLTHTRNLEFINSLIEDITQLMEHVGNDKAYASISRIIKKLEQQNSDKCWEEFETRFQEIHRRFYQKLHDSFPGLTPNDVKLCALLKMGMNTKEMCSVTFQSVRAVEAARLRLRKKLELANGENLGVFLQRI